MYSPRAKMSNTSGGSSWSIGTSASINRHRQDHHELWRNLRQPAMKPGYATLLSRGWPRTRIVALTPCIHAGVQARVHHKVRSLHRLGKAHQGIEFLIGYVVASHIPSFFINHYQYSLCWVYNTGNIDNKFTTKIWSSFVLDCTSFMQEIVTTCRNTFSLTWVWLCRCRCACIYVCRCALYLRVCMHLCECKYIWGYECTCLSLYVSVHAY